MKRHGSREEDLPEIETQLLEKMHRLLKIRPAVEWLKPNTLERSSKKTQFLEKTYEE